MYRFEEDLQKIDPVTVDGTYLIGGVEIFKRKVGFTEKAKAEKICSHNTINKLLKNSVLFEVDRTTKS